MTTIADHEHMTRALRLARRGLYTTMPNPRVGCVIARGDEVLGEGWHQRAGAPHAEVFALRAAGERARGATVYVTLEPCSHHGRTPPCADALIEAGVARVVVACGDPNPRIDGGGLRRLRDAGITVETGLMHDAARELNVGFFSRIERGRPFVRVKLAMSLDGRTALASGESKWITGDAARSDVARWRARSSAILTGAGTARADNPHLTVRLEPFAPDATDTDDPRQISALSSGEAGGESWGKRQPRASSQWWDHAHRPTPEVGIAGLCPPYIAGFGTRNSRRPPALLPLPRTDSSFGGEGWGEGAKPHAATPSDLAGEPMPRDAFVPPLRIVLDARLDALPANANLLDGSTPTLVLHAPDAQPRDNRCARAELVAVDPTPDGRLDLDAVLRLLAARGVNELQVEAGPTLCGALFARGLVDELLLYIAPVLLGDQARPLLALPSLALIADRWQLAVVDQRQIGPDLRLRMRSVGALRSK